MKFLLDENAHHGLVAFLAELGHEAKPCPKSISNGEVIKFAVKEGRIVITHELRKFLSNKSAEDFTNKVTPLSDAE